jgi:hypothetical protein
VQRRWQTPLIAISLLVMGVADTHIYKLLAEASKWLGAIIVLLSISPAEWNCVTSIRASELFSNIDFIEKEQPYGNLSNL